MVGNHRDAWVYGAVDPGSGTAATLEMCRALGAAVKNGWKPRRTLVYASWDAEEYGLVGSTEWAEEHATEVDQEGRAPAQRRLGGQRSRARHGRRAVAARPGARRRRGDHRRPNRQVAARHLDRRRAHGLGRLPAPLVLATRSGTMPAGRRIVDGPNAARAVSSPRCTPLGSGSDYTVFLDHLGVPALDIGFSGGYGVYHSIYDDFTWMEKFGDPEFLTHTMAARLYTVLIMRAAAAEVLPFRFVPYGEALRDHVDELRLIQRRRVAGKADAPAKPGRIDGGRGETSMASHRWSAPCAHSRPRRRRWTRRSMPWRHATAFRPRHSTGSTSR